VVNEPIRLRGWQEMHLYEKVQAARAAGNKGKWILHDGPPFANGDIHIGHLINKTLKDVIIRFRTMQGYQTPYVPGWDCHGLPIEHKIQQDLGPKLREMDTVAIRRKCFEYAAKYVGIQSEQFQRLGILGAWDKPYLTMTPDYEAQVLEVFARFVEAGLVHKKLKPVAWSIENQTALADAELEYQDIIDPSVFVEFALDDQAAARSAFGLAEHPVSLLIWTTTPWTLPARTRAPFSSRRNWWTKCLPPEQSPWRAISIAARASPAAGWSRASSAIDIRSSIASEELSWRNT
jgi:isoleucyl-tRNA synthetase